MRKALVIMCIGFVLLSCGSENNTAKENKGSESEKPAVAQTPAEICSVDMPYDENTMDDYPTALGKIKNYIAETTKETNTYSFIFDNDANLQKYVSDPSLYYIHFIIGQEPGGGRIKLYLSATDVRGNHIYLRDKSDPSKYYAFKNRNYRNYETPGVTPTIGTVPTTEYMDNTISIISAKNWITNYYKEASKNTSTYSFLLKASVFSKFVKSSTDIKKMRFYLSVNGPNLALILLGYDATGNVGSEILLKEGAANYYALEYFRPCPECIDGAEKLHFETPCQQKTDFHMHYYENMKEKFDSAYLSGK